MTEWFYKVVPAKAGFEDTRLLAKKSGFVCRPAHQKSGALFPEGKGPALGDTLHFYFVPGRQAPRAIGAYEITAAEGHPHAARFGAGVAETALFPVTDPGFASQLRSFEEYREDPVLSQFTGWLVKAASATIAPLPPHLAVGQVTVLKQRAG